VNGNQSEQEPSVLMRPVQANFCKKASGTHGIPLERKSLLKTKAHTLLYVWLLHYNLF
jgi:hypothetical protein